MPPLPVITNAFRVAYNWRDDIGHHAVNVMHFLTAAPSDPAAVAGVITDHTTQPMWTTISGEYVCRSLSITPLDGVSSTTEIPLADDDRWHGAGAGQPVPAVSGLVKLSTGFRGRSRRGRVFIGPTSEDLIARGVVDDFAMAAWQAAWEGFRSGLPDDSMELIVASYTLGDSEPVTSVLCEQALATQRRRQERVRG